MHADKDNEKNLTKSKLNEYLNEISKEYKRIGGRSDPIELILVGGASILENYGFRQMTRDVDAYYPRSELMKRAVNIVGDRHGLPNGWFNSDFVKSESFSDKLRLCSVPFRTFNQILEVRTIEGAYLIAMKLVAGRNYKKDLSDIVGILSEHFDKGTPLCFGDIDKAVKEFYGNWGNISEDMISFVKNAVDSQDYNKLYELVSNYEDNFRATKLASSENKDFDAPRKSISQILKEYSVKVETNEKYNTAETGIGK